MVIVRIIIIIGLIIVFKNLYHNITMAFITSKVNKVLYKMTDPSKELYESAERLEKLIEEQQELDVEMSNNIKSFNLSYDCQKSCQNLLSDVEDNEEQMRKEIEKFFHLYWGLEK